MEKLIVIAVIIIGSIIHSWIQRKREEAEEASSPRPSFPRPPSPGQRPGQTGAPMRRPAVPRPDSPGTGGMTGDWQEDLRRLLQGEIPGATPRTESPPVLPPARASRPPAAPPPLLAHSDIPVPGEGQEMEVGLPVAPVNLSQVDSAHERAQVQSSAAQRLQDASSQVSAHLATPSSRARPAGRRGVARQIFRDRQTQRDAMVASIVLGPPRALEPGS